MLKKNKQNVFKTLINARNLNMLQFSTNKKFIHISLPEPQHAAFKDLCSEHKVTMQKAVLEALDLWLVAKVGNSDKA